jgi:hypothetical protein
VAKPTSIWQNLNMTRDDMFVLLSFAGFVVLCMAAMWVLFPI